MSAMTFLFEGMMALLMVALIVYCVKLNRGLAGVRGQDEQIKQMIMELNRAADRADASVSRLKAAGLTAEASVRAALQDADRLRTDLAARRRPAAASISALDAVSDDVSDAAAEEALFGRDVPDHSRPAVRVPNREQNEAAVLTAIRAARGDS